MEGPFLSKGRPFVVSEGRIPTSAIRVVTVWGCGYLDRAGRTMQCPRGEDGRIFEGGARA